MANKISNEIDPHSLGVHKLIAFWALDQLMNEASDRFSANQIADFLVEKIGIPISRQAISHYLQSDKKAIHKKGNQYKLMEDGRRQLSTITNNGNQTILVKSGTPFSTKHVVMKEILAPTKGTLHISDPYVDVKTLDLIFNNVPQGISIKLLTANINDKPTGSFKRHLDELNKEGIDIEVAVYSNSQLHDRYFFDDNIFWWSGNSLNGLGAKESFLINLGADIRQSMKTTFDNRWKVSIKI